MTGLFRKLKEKNLHAWLPGYARHLIDRARERSVDGDGGPRHVLFAFCDHYEPLWGGAEVAKGRARVRAWQERYPVLAEQFVDAPPKGPEPEHIETWLADLGTRRAPATVNKRHIAVALFFKWLLVEGEITASPMRNMTAPDIPINPVPVADDDALRKLLKACDGKEFADRRDTAIIRLLIDTGLRRGELAAMKLDDLDLDADLAHVVGKGNRRRTVPFGSKTSSALDRYLRARKKHPRKSSNALWLGVRGPITGSGVAQILETRCARAGIPKLHPHQLRHTFAHQWLREGLGETDLMALTGWRSRSMLSRYAASAAAERARDAHRRAGLGDRL